MTRRRLIELQRDERKDSSITFAKSSLLMNVNEIRSVVSKGVLGKWQNPTLRSTILQAPR